ncbi:TetR family transcriptional regulator C-terminal domain-containing protein [Phycicoccus sp. Soil803]|uniref:TetR family transcriptional regulator C-terminal domain-containing protein n=1 Tax=Phycicoccus sp. Soil803 TaxID=1736415 RepID=UPI00138EEE4E|nr:TetR family transcriptional regulator C-terminal domain-containing protein [Phycicoccus sp. Soil803]
MAEYSGFSRSHIRHYLGNRDAVIDSVWSYLLTPYEERFADLLSLGSPDEQVANLLDFLFGPEMETAPEDAAIQALINESLNDPALSAKVSDTYDRLIKAFADGLRRTGRFSSASQADRAAFSVISMALGASTLSLLPAQGVRRTAARANAAELVLLPAASGSRSAKRR